MENGFVKISPLKVNKIGSVTTKLFFPHPESCVDHNQTFAFPLHLSPKMFQSDNGERKWVKEASLVNDGRQIAQEKKIPVNCQ